MGALLAFDRTSRAGHVWEGGGLGRSHPAGDNPAAVCEQPYQLYLCSERWSERAVRTPPARPHYRIEIIMVKRPSEQPDDSHDSTQASDVCDTARS